MPWKHYIQILYPVRQHLILVVMHQDNLLPPKDIPDLSALHAQAGWMSIMRALGAGGSVDHVSYILQMNCVRLMDAAIRDYTLGRQSIIAFHSCKPGEFGVGYITQATTHFESCIWHLERFIKHARALRSSKTAESELKQLVPKDLSFFNPAAESRITRLRHTLAHLEESAQDGKLPSGPTIALMPLESGLTIASHEIQWGELTDWLQDAHFFVKKLTRFKPAAIS